MSKDTNNRGAFFKNKDKKSEKHPDYRGSCMIEDVKYWVSVWISKSQRGETYFSVSYTKKDNQDDVPNPNQDNKPGDHKPDDSFDDDLPF